MTNRATISPAAFSTTAFPPLVIETVWASRQSNSILTSKTCPVAFIGSPMVMEPILISFQEAVNSDLGIISFNDFCTAYHRLRNHSPNFASHDLGQLVYALAHIGTNFVQSVRFFSSSRLRIRRYFTGLLRERRANFAASDVGMTITGTGISRNEATLISVSHEPFPWRSRRTDGPDTPHLEATSDCDRPRASIACSTSRPYPGGNSGRPLVAISGDRHPRHPYVDRKVLTPQSVADQNRYPILADVAKPNSWPSILTFCAGSFGVACVLTSPSISTPTANNVTPATRCLPNIASTPNAPASTDALLLTPLNVSSCLVEYPIPRPTLGFRWPNWTPNIASPEICAFVRSLTFRLPAVAVSTEASKATAAPTYSVQYESCNAVPEPIAAPAMKPVNLAASELSLAGVAEPDALGTAASLSTRNCVFVKAKATSPSPHAVLSFLRYPYASMAATISRTVFPDLKRACISTIAFISALVYWAFCANAPASRASAANTGATNRSINPPSPAPGELLASSAGAASGELPPSVHQRLAQPNRGTQQHPSLRSSTVEINCGYSRLNLDQHSKTRLLVTPIGLRFRHSRHGPLDRDDQMLYTIPPRRIAPPQITSTSRLSSPTFRTLAQWPTFRTANEYSLRNSAAFPAFSIVETPVKSGVSTAIYIARVAING